MKTQCVFCELRTEFLIIRPYADELVVQKVNM
jgi:hypothetical protein